MTKQEIELSIMAIERFVRGRNTYSKTTNSDQFWNVYLDRLKLFFNIYHLNTLSISFTDAWWVELDIKVIHDFDVYNIHLSPSADLKSELEGIEKREDELEIVYHAIANEHTAYLYSVIENGDDAVEDEVTLKFNSREWNITGTKAYKHSMYYKSWELRNILTAINIKRSGTIYTDATLTGMGTAITEKLAKNMKRSYKNMI